MTSAMAITPTATTAESSAEIISVSGEGITLAYSDSPLRVVGFIDITDPSAPVAKDNLDVDGEPTVVSIMAKPPLSA